MSSSRDSQKLDGKIFFVRGGDRDCVINLNASIKRVIKNSKMKFISSLVFPFKNES